ncbi:MAG: hypothetical protein ACOYK8_05840 [Alphaproteobacteria bacterium]
MASNEDYFVESLMLPLSVPLVVLTMLSLLNWRINSALNEAKDKNLIVECRDDMLKGGNNCAREQLPDVLRYERLEGMSIGLQSGIACLMVGASAIAIRGITGFFMNKRANSATILSNKADPTREDPSITTQFNQLSIEQNSALSDGEKILIQGIALTTTSAELVALKELNPVEHYQNQDVIAELYAQRGQQLAEAEAPSVAFKTILVSTRVDAGQCFQRALQKRLKP